ncbi:MAG: hypothetical protein RR277_00275 [Rikenellaceae bacterium]
MKFVATLILFFSLMSCTKSSTDCTYFITCSEQLVKDKEKVLSTEITGFIFFADTATYTPKSYAEAVSGNISTKAGDKPIKADMLFEFDATTGVAKAPNITRAGKSVFVLCDNKNKIYSFRQFVIETDLPQIITSLDFLLYNFVKNPDTTIIVSRWIQKK